MENGRKKDCICPSHIVIFPSQKAVIKVLYSGVLSKNASDVVGNTVAIAYSEE
jgi:hypothetical protein